MILRALHELYGRLEADPDYDVAPPGKSYQKVTFIVVLEPSGALVDIQDARQPVDGRPRPRRVLVPGGAKPSGAGMNPCLLWDAPGYLLGWDAEKPERARRTFDSFREKHLKLERELGTPAFSAVCHFLQSWEPARSGEYPILREVETGYGVFQLRGETRFVHEHPEIGGWWEKHVSETEPGPVGQCLITGEIGPIARLHSTKIKSVDGAKMGGATIVGLNDPSYWSYGLEQSFNAPTSELAAHRYTTALNALLDGPKRNKHRLVVGGTTVAFWTDRPSPTEDIFMAFLAEGSAPLGPGPSQDESIRRKLEAFLKAVRRGLEKYGELEAQPRSTSYFILGLGAPTPARVAVRFFHQGSLAELLENLRRHHADIGIERQFGDDAKRPEPELPPARLLLDQTCPRKNGLPDREKIPPLLAGPLLEAVITGHRYPEGLYATVIRRVTTDRVVNYPRACVIKGYLVRNLRKELSMSLDTSRPEPAYRLGRLFAALEKTQLQAHDDKINVTIRDSFYGTASATPRAVFPRLMRTYQHHLAKLEGGRKVNREKLVQEILAPVSDVPAHLGLADQGLFALGYYHQMNAFYTKKSDAEPNPEC